MAVKSLLEVDVDDKAFRAFVEKFRSYQEAAKAGPSIWQKVSEQISAASGAIAGLRDGSLKASEAAGAFAQAAEDARGSLEDLGKRSNTQGHVWHQLARDSKDFATNITSATRQLLRWASLTGVISGLLGAGGLFGIDRLAISAGNQRRYALGLGVTPGEQNAFSINYGRVVSPEAILGGVNEATHDVTKRWQLYAAGLTDKDIQGKDTAEVSSGLIAQAKRLVDQTPQALLGQLLTSRGLGGLGFSLQDLERLKNTPAGEIAGYGSSYRRDVGTLSLPPSVMKAWQDLQVQLQRAGAELEKDLIQGLVKLTGPIGDLSNAVVKALNTFIQGGAAQAGIEGLAHGVEWLAGELGSEEFRTGIQQFSQDIITVAKATGEALHWIASWFNGGGGGDKGGASGKGGLSSWLPDHNSPEWKAEEERRLKAQAEWDKQHSSQGSGGGMWGHLPWGGGSLFPGSYTPGAGSTSPWLQGGPSLINASFRVPMATGDKLRNAEIAHDFFRRVGYTEAQTDGILGNISAESGFNPAAMNASGHQGLFQWDQQRSARFRQMFGHDPAQGTVQEQLMFAYYELQTTEAGTNHALMAFGNTQGAAADIFNRGFERSGTSSEARMAAAGQYGALFKDRSVQVEINNNTGGSAIVSANQLSI